MVLDQEFELLGNLDINEDFRDDLRDAINHGILVSNLAGMLTRNLEKDENLCHEMSEAGMVHDIGKLRLGDYLYGRRKDTLKIEEMKYVRLHPALGYEELKKSGNYSETILQSVYHHHENYDGSGYPDNLKGKLIPLGARILRVCDVFAALVSVRPYRSAFGIDISVEMMIDEVKNFDMQIFLTFMEFVHSEEFASIRTLIQRINRKKM